MEKGKEVSKMPESETSKKLTKAIKAVDKFVSDLQKNGRKVTEALKELKESGEKEKDG